MGLDRFFEVISCGDAVPHKKPDGRHVLACIEQLGATPKTTAMIGDSENDISAAIDAGVRSVWINRSGAERPTSIDGVPEITNLTQLFEMLEDL